MVSKTLWILAIVFATLKLAGAVTWSWWATLTPLWAMVGWWVLVFIVAAILAVVSVKRDDDEDLKGLGDSLSRVKS